MPSPCRLSPSEPLYPARLRDLPNPPSELWYAGDLSPCARTVTIVGSRAPLERAERFAVELAQAVTRAGAVVLSGGAVGIDAAAHRGALTAGGRTWVIAPTGFKHVYPAGHTDLFAEVAQRGGAMLWPFPPDAPARTGRFFRRNGVLAALADAVVVVQAGIPSGALNTAAWARRLSRALFVVPAFPWEEPCAGSVAELARGARPLTSIDGLLEALSWQSGSASPAPLSLSPDEDAVYGAMTHEPAHVDAIALHSGLPVSTIVPLLLTLTLQNVVVEGPQGFFRRGAPP